MTSEDESVMAPVINVKPSQESEAWGPRQVHRGAPLGVELGSCPSRHLWRWESTAPIVWEIGIMPQYLEARDVVTILAKREKCSSVFSPGRRAEKEQEGLSVRFIEFHSATVLNIQLIPFHTTKPFIYNDKCWH